MDPERELTCVLVDDEGLARRELRRLLAPFPWVHVVGEAGHVAQAEELVRTVRPDLVFLDIEMPGGTGFDLLERMQPLPAVVFTTAYDHHAVRAFGVGAVHYLLKPIEPPALAEALARVRKVVPASGALGAGETLFVRDGARAHLIPIAEVKVFASEGNYVRIVWKDVEPLAATSLVALEAKLDPQRVFRANRGEVINLAFIEAIDAAKDGRLTVRMRGGPDVAVSRRQARLLAVARKL